MKKLSYDHVLISTENVNKLRSEKIHVREIDQRTNESRAKWV